MKNIKEKINIKITEEPVSYSILIGEGIIDDLNKHLKKCFSGKQIFLVTDKNVEEIYGSKITSLLENSNYRFTIYTVPPGEKAKSYKYFKKGLDLLVNNDFKRDDLVIAFGGGVVGDLAGFLAASYMRGISLLQIPTTLLSQVDSSVGGKTAINHTQGKNLIGAFYQPERVIIDSDFLKTLPLRELKTGIAEVIKYGIIFDEDFFSFLEDHKEAIYNLNSNSIVHIVNKSCKIKADIVIEDQKEHGRRALLNFGHTIAHALEAVSEYDEFTHGEAVAVGMYGSARLCRDLGYIRNQTYKKIENILTLYELPISLGNKNPEKIYDIMQHDKKARKDELRWILIKDIGKAVIKKGISKKKILKVLEGLQ